MEIEITQPAKFCPTCGGIIPENGYEIDGKGNLVLDENKRPIFHGKPALICLKCALAAQDKKPRKFPLSPGERSADQLEIEAPSIFID